MKNIYGLLFCFIFGSVGAQKPSQKNWQYGFSLGFETQTLGIEPLDGKEPEQTAVSPGRNQAGVTVGLAVQKTIWRSWYVQTGLSVSHNRNPVDFRPGGQTTFRFTDLELPVYAVFTNKKNVGLPLRGKVMFGPRIGWNMAENPSDRLQFLRERLALDLGLGVEIRMGKWLLCPEAIYSHGLNNLHDFTGTDFDFLVGREVRDKLAFRVLLLRAK